MTREDFGRVAVGAPALHRVVVLTLRDCLLVKQWSRAEAGDPDAAAAHLGATFRSAIEALRVLGTDATPLGITVETKDALVVVRALGDEAAVGFVFDRSAPMGLVRLQVEQLSEHLLNMMPGLQAAQDLPQPAPASEAPSISSANATVVMPSHTDLPAVPRPAPATEAPAPERPRAVRLLEFFRRYAPDPHASMLRLSLRTGISLEALERPEQLDDGQVEAVAASVSDILGQEQVGL